MVPYSDADRRLVSCALAGDGAGVRAALRGGAGHHLPGPDGRLPLHVAAAAGHADVITGLLQAGADLHASSGMPRDDGGRALHLAAEGGHTEVLRLLAAAGTPLDSTDDKGRTAVHWAALRGQLDALVTLHTLGSDLHILDHGHANALHFAVASGSLEAVRWLVEVAGVSVTQLDVNRRSPYDVAKRKGHKHMLSYLKQSTQQQEQSQQAVLRRQSAQPAGPSAWVYSQESPSQSQQEASAPWNQSQQSQHSVVSRSRSQDMSAWNQSQQNQHTYPPRPRSQHDTTAWSQQNQHPVVSRAYSQQESATWSQGQHKPLSRQQSQRDTSVWVQSQQVLHQDEEPRSALTLLTQQNQDYRKKIAELEEREAAARQRTAADQQSLAELRKEVDRLTGILQSEARESESGRQIAALREEVHHLTFMLDDAGRRALATQEAQQRKIEALKNQEELNKRTLTELTRRLTLAEESNGAMMAEARDRERSETLLRGEVDRLKLALAAAPKADAYAQLQTRAHRLSEQDALHRQAILALRRQLEAARTPSPAPPPPPAPAPTDQRKLREATLEAEKSKEEAATLSAKLQGTQARAADAERLANAYKRQLGECERELREERETNGKLVSALREEVAELRGRMEAVKKRAVSSLTRSATHLSSDA